MPWQSRTFSHPPSGSGDDSVLSSSPLGCHLTHPGTLHCTMRTRVARPVLVLSAVLAALALSFAPRLAGTSFTDHPGRGTRPAEHVGAASVFEAVPVVARIDQRDTTIDRALKHRLVLVAVIATLVSVPILVRRASRASSRGERTSTAAPSPFCGRAPPQLAALCA